MQHLECKKLSTLQTDGTPPVHVGSPHGRVGLGGGFGLEPSAHLQSGRLPSPQALGCGLNNVMDLIFISHFEHFLCIIHFLLKLLDCFMQFAYGQRRA